MSAETQTNDVVIELDKPRRLRYPVRALRLVEDRSRRNLGELLISHASIGAACWLVWAGLIADDAAFAERREPAITIDEVSDLLDEYWFGKGRSVGELSALYATALTEAGVFSRRDPTKKAPPVAEAVGIALPPTTGSPTGTTTPA